MLEFFSIAGFRLALDGLRSGWKFWNRNIRKLTAKEKLELRQKWKKPFEDYIFNSQRKELRLDAIMRDIRRLDEYPDIDDKAPGISPWFRFGLVDTYERGFMAALTGRNLFHDEKTDKWRFLDRANGEEGGHYLDCIGYVPYEFIEQVDWDGDRYYNYPQIYCYFDGIHKQPYERIVYCERFTSPPYNIMHFREIVDQEDVVKESRKAGIKDFW
ncbi:hypothetical protein EN873_22375 [bacterium M00.F.Ca.ET.230.01.1.1]|nr:hypothetical protein EN873_22375 [bacterium M00.F.Ca.ET.230.01.1.1]